MPSLDDVVVVRDRLAGLDGAVLGRRGVRRDAACEPRGVEAEHELTVPALERVDVAEDPVAARPYRHRPGRRFAAEVQNREDDRRDRRDDCERCEDDERAVHGVMAILGPRCS
jgi:hypothetical protein